MLKTVSDRKCLAFTIGLLILGGFAETARASCDVEEVCKYVEKEKEKARKKAREAAEANTAEQSGAAENAEQTSDAGTAGQSSDIENDMQLFEDALAKILDQCGYEMDATERVCKLEDVIRHCWYKNEDALEYCKD